MKNQLIEVTLLENAIENIWKLSSALIDEKDYQKLNELDDFDINSTNIVNMNFLICDYIEGIGNMINQLTQI